MGTIYTTDMSDHPSQTTPVIGTMNTDQVAAAQADTARILATPRAHRAIQRRNERRLPPYCGCCGCITRYCNCSCCCQK